MPTNNLDLEEELYKRQREANVNNETARSVTAVIAPDEMDSSEVLKQLDPKAVRFMALANMHPSFTPFTKSVMAWCEVNNISFMCFLAHWDTYPENADQVAINNLSIAASRLVVFMDANRPIKLMTYLILLFKRDGRPVQIIQIGKKKEIV